MNRMPTKEMTYEEGIMESTLTQVTIGGSEAAAAIGLSRYKSQLRLYLEKIGEVEREPAGEAAYWGNILEEIVAQEFAKRTGKKVQRVNKTFVHEKYPFAIGHIDRKVVGENALLECKTTSIWKDKEWSTKEDEIPQEYLIQVMHYLAVTGYERAYVAVLIGGQKFAVKEFSRDEELIDYIMEAEKKFYEMIVNRTPPALDGSDDASKILSLLYPSAQEGSTIELPVYEGVVEEILALDKQIKELEQMKEEKENTIKNAMGNYETAIIGRYTISWKNVTTERLDTKELKKANPDIYAQFTKQSSYRRFTIKEG